MSLDAQNLPEQLGDLSRHPVESVTPHRQVLSTRCVQGRRCDLDMMKGEAGLGFREGFPVRRGALKGGEGP